jgi:cellulose synthase/poly-beta-1,6-N-acetylglucosamine synthase-like glycosyltransferase
MEKKGFQDKNECLFLTHCMTTYILFLILFSIASFLICYAYVVFPLILSRLSAKRKKIPLMTEGNMGFEAVSILISAYNEESVIEEKLKSIVNLNYPKDKIEVLVGSDASDDATHEIVKMFEQKHSFIKLVVYNERRGKPSVINDLFALARHELVVLTDANVMFEKEVLTRLIKQFRNPKVGLVGANILNIGLKKDGISIQEKSYIERENLIKYREGKLWGTMMGPFGGCFAMRKKLFSPIPAGFLVDDFYLSMKVLEKKYHCINDLDAICYEDVSNDILQEYKRKARISAGNFQNLSAFRCLLFRPFTPEGFCFISHKFLRWITPFLILITVLSLLVLSFYDKIFLFLLIAELLLLFAPIFDSVLGKMGIHLRLLRFVAYFSYMNLALLKGFFRFVNGIKSGVWTPTKRES